MLTQEEILEIRKDFPYLSQDWDKKIVYLDSAATTQKPQGVLDALTDYYKFQNANPHRGAHYLGQVATEVFEEGRQVVADFIGAQSPNEIIFTNNTTQSLNTLAYTLGLNKVKEGDEIVITILEHHSNLIPWQYVAEKTGTKLRYIYIDKDSKELREEDLDQVLSEKTKILSLTASSNTLGTLPKVKEIIQKAKAKSKDIYTIVDGAQAAPHHKVDVQDLDCDFYAFSGHKLLAPMGIGVLYGKEEKLNDLPPFFYGGEMIEYVYEDHSTFLKAPMRFEAGTQNVGGVKGLVEAIRYLEAIGLDEIDAYEGQLTQYCYDQVKDMDFLDLYTVKNDHRGSVITFNLDQVHPHDVASILDSYGIAIRSGHHCTQPLHRYLGINASCRASFAFYNTREEVDQFVNHLNDVRRMMGLGSK